MCNGLEEPHLVPYREHYGEAVTHGVMFDGHEQCVHYDTDGDPQVHEGVHDHQPDQSLQLDPRRTTFPDQVGLCKVVPASQLPGLFCRENTESASTEGLFHCYIQPSLTPYRAHVHECYSSIESCPRAR